MKKSSVSKIWNLGSIEHGLAIVKKFFFGFWTLWCRGQAKGNCFFPQRTKSKKITESLVTTLVDRLQSLCRYKHADKLTRESAIYRAAVNFRSNHMFHDTHAFFFLYQKTHFFQIIITIHLTGLSSKKRRKDVSSESIENILYYQDCNHRKQIPQQPTPLAAQRPLLQQQEQQQCKMCCTMCCGDQCVDSHQQLQHQPGRQLFNGQIEPKSMGVIQPGRLPPRERRKKDKFPLPMKPPLPGRRGMGR